MFKKTATKKKKRKKRIDRKKILAYIKGHKKYFVYFGIFLLVATSVYILFVPKPNDKIKEVRRGIMFQNVNPNFRVGFGDRKDTTKQYVRFDGNVSVNNPFSSKKVTLLDRIKGLFVSQKGFEMSLSSVRWGETESENSMLDNIRPIAVDLGVDDIKTSTEVTEVGRLLGELPSDEPVSKDTVINRDIYPGIDLEYQILEGIGFKEEIVIRDMDMYLSSCQQTDECILPLNEFIFDFTVDEGVVIKEYDLLTKDGVTPPYYLEDKQGRYIAHFLPTYAIDGANEKTYEVGMRADHVEGNNYEIVVTLDPEWLFSVDREFPIRIDPSIIHDTKNQFDEGIFNRTESLAGPKVQIEESKHDAVDTNTVAYWKLEETGIGDSGTIGTKTTGAYHATTNFGTVYTVSTPLHLTTTEVDMSVAGSATFVLIEWNNGPVGSALWTRTYSLAAGVNTVNLGITIPSTGTYFLYRSGTTSIHRTDALYSFGGDSNIVSVTGADYAGTTYDRYYYFYNLSYYLLYDIEDSSSNNNDGVSVGAVYKADAVVGGGRWFDGSSNYIQVEDSSALRLVSSSLTISAWVYYESGGTSTFPRIVAKNVSTAGNADGWLLSVRNDNRSINMGVGGSYIETGIQIPVQKWTQVTWTADGTSWSLYLDGLVVWKESRSALPNSTTMPVIIGNSTTYDRHWHGGIDEVHIKNTALSAEDIMKSYIDSVGNYYGTYSSSEIDFEDPSYVQSMSWVEYGVHTGDGEIPYSTNGLLAQWDLNETSGTTAVSGGSCGTSCNGTLTNFASTTGQDVAPGTGWTSDNRKWGDGALMFDGTDDYISLPSAAILPENSSISISVWIKPTSYPSGTTRVVGRMYGSTGAARSGSIHFNGVQKNIYFFVDNTSLVRLDLYSDTIELGKWYHVVGTWNQTTEKAELYINGVLQSEGTLAGPSRSGASTPVIGYSADTANVYFPGVIDTVSIYTRALSATEVLSNYQGSNIEYRYRYSEDGNQWSNWGGGEEESLENFSNPYLYDLDTPGLVGYWPMNETSGSTVYNVVGGNTGSVSGALIRDGVHEKGRGFDGVDDIITIGTVDRPKNNFSVETWFNTNVTHQIDAESTTGTLGVNGQRYLFGALSLSSNDDVVMGVSVGTNGISVYEHGNSYMPALAVYSGNVTNSWNHLVVVYNNKKPSIYLNGKLVRVGLTSTKVNVYATNQIGGGSYGFHSGHVDEVRIYNQVLDPHTIQRNYLRGTDTGLLKQSDRNITVDGSSNSLRINQGSLPTENSLVGYWKLDETGGSGAYLKDYSGNNNHGTPTGTTYVGNGKVGGGRSLNGTSDYISINSVNPFRSNFTVETWVKFDQVNKGTGAVYDNGILGHGTAATNNGLHLGERGAVAWFGFYGNDLAGTRTLNAGEWYHLAFVYDGGKKIYVNGVLDSSGTSNAYLSSSSNATIGRYPWNMAGYFSGTIDEVRISNTARTYNEITELYKMGKDKYVNNPLDSMDLSDKTMMPFQFASDQLGTNIEAMVGNSPYTNYQADKNTAGLWHLDELSSTGAYIKDSSGNNNHGTPTGTTYSQGKIGGARDFNGTDTSYISQGTGKVLAALSGAPGITISAWIKGDSWTNAYNEIFGEFINTTVYAVGIRVMNTGIIQFGGRSQPADAWQFTNSNTTLTVGNWYHVTGQLDYENKRLKIYINGVLDQDVSATFGSNTLIPGTPTGDSRIGGCYGQIRHFTGTIDEVHLSRTARTPAEIREAYEYGLRTHPVKVDFKADLQSSNLITGSSDLSFSIDERDYGASNYVVNLNVGDKIIVKENYDGTEYIAQGTVDTLNNDTGAITATRWDSESTFPSGGFTVNATVFKWQEEYIDVRHFPDSSTIKHDELDTSFDPRSGPNDYLKALAIQEDGKVVIVGGFTTYAGVTRQRIARLNSDGSLDTSFDSSSGASGVINAVAIQGDGKIVIGGGFTTYAGVTRQRIARLNSDGSLDTSFDSSSGAGSSVEGIAIQNDGRIVIVGLFTTYAGITRQYVARLNNDGSLDTSFDSSSGASLTVRTVAIQSDGKILIGGEFSTYAGITRQRIARLNSNGSLDTGFISTSGAGSTVYSIAIQSDGKIVIGGAFTTYAGVTRQRVARINSDGSLDTSFGTTTGANGIVLKTLIQENGKVLIGGVFSTYLGVTRQGIALLNSDGSLDTSFDSSSGVGGVAQVDDIKVQDDGRILLAGYYDSYAGIPRLYVARLGMSTSLVSFRLTNSIGANYWIDDIRSGKYMSSNQFVDGLLDESFDSSYGANNTVLALAIQSDGKIVIGGSFTTYGGMTRQYVARLNSDGSLDTSFDSSNGANNYVWTLAIQSDGKILIGGSFTTYGGVTRQYVARLNSDGSLDTSFNSSSGANDSVYALAIQSDGKIIIGGIFTTYASTTRQYVARLNSDGSLDTGFDSSSGTNNTVQAVAIQSDGKIVISGGFTTYAGVTRQSVARINTDGSLDTSFDSSSGTNSTVGALAIQSDGKVLIGGGFTTYAGVTRKYLARLNSDGSLDTSFDSSSGAGSAVSALAIQSDGKILIGGGFSSYGGVTRQYVARLNADSSLDTSFDSSSGANNYVYALAIQSDGNVLIGGSFTSYGGVTRQYIARLNNPSLSPDAIGAYIDASLDNGFDSSSGAGSTVNAVAIQSDGKIVIGGWFTTYAGVTRQRVARLSSDGSLDTSFDSSSGANSFVTTVAIQSDGKILIGGSFTTYAGTTRQYVARLNSDGSLDTSFDSSIGANASVTGIAIQSDGKIVISGNFSTYGGTARERIARLNSDGSLDTSFDSSIGANGGVYAVAIQSDGKIVIGGWFTTYSGVTRQNMARLNSDGSLDTSFDSSSGTNSGVFTLAIQSNGKIVIGGEFTSYAGVTRQYIARLNSDGSLDTSFDSSSGAGPGEDDPFVHVVAIQSNGKILIGGAFTTYSGTTRQYMARVNSDGSLDTSFDSSSGANSSVNAIAIQSDGKIVIGGTFTTYAGTTRQYIARIGNVKQLPVQYFQYKPIFTSKNSNITAFLTKMEINYEPYGPQMNQVMRHGKWFNSGGVKQPYWWAQ